LQLESSFYYTAITATENNAGSNAKKQVQTTLIGTVLTISRAKQQD